MMLRTAGSSSIAREDVPLRDPCANQIGGQHQQRLADAIPTEDLPAAPAQSELRILVVRDLRLRSPEPVRGLQTIGGVGRSEFARLHDEGEQSRRKAEKKQRVPQPAGQG